MLKLAILVGAGGAVLGACVLALGVAFLRVEADRQQSLSLSYDNLDHNSQGGY